MDQAQLLTLIGSLYDKLVDDVAQRVIDRTRTALENDSAIMSAVEAAIVHYMETRFDIDNYVDIDDKVGEAINDWDISDKISEEFENLDISDKVQDALEGARISVTLKL